MIELKKQFPGQQTDEKTVLLARVHWFRFAGSLIFTLFLVVLWFVAWTLINQYSPALLKGMWGNIGMLFSFAYFLFIALYLFISWINYYLDVWILTNERLIDIDQKSLFSRSISELSLEQVQNVKAETKGFLSTLLRFGDVNVETAGAEIGRFTFRSIPKPFEVEEKVLVLSEEFMKRRGKEIIGRSPSKFPE